MSNCANLTKEQRDALIATMPRKARLPRQCEHIKANGEFCGSPALRGRHHCYFHLTQLGRKIRAEREHERAVTQAIAAESVAIELPPLEDANAIQVALMQVSDAIVHQRIDPARARLVLRALQIARTNLANGVDFRQAQGATIAGRYDDFENDFQLEDSAPSLKLDHGDESREEEDAHAAELARLQELADAYARVGTAREQAEQRITARHDAGEEVSEDEEVFAALEGDRGFHCHPVERLLCKVFGPRSQDDPPALRAWQERDVPSQRRVRSIAQDSALKKAA